MLRAMHLAGISEPKPQAACLARNLGAMPNQASTRHVCAPRGCATVSTPCLCRWPRRARMPPPRSASRRCGLRCPSAGPRARCTSARKVGSCRCLHHTGISRRNLSPTPAATRQASWPIAHPASARPLYQLVRLLSASARVLLHPPAAVLSTLAGTVSCWLAIRLSRATPHMSARATSVIAGPSSLVSHV